ncbi:hypothetical protein F4808DRAFT_40312 [Astrocystis sublimbata]|nr:hypothetical protein F4808DRAFT_40312 [Astrocystis sublimbata]
MTDSPTRPPTRALKYTANQPPAADWCLRQMQQVGQLPERHFLVSVLCNVAWYMAVQSHGSRDPMTLASWHGLNAWLLICALVTYSCVVPACAILCPWASRINPYFCYLILFFCCRQWLSIRISGSGRDKIIHSATAG